MYFWRGARQKNLRWWGPLWKKPDAVHPLTLGEFVRFFLVGVFIALALWLAWSAIS